jgi:hypothetical protein
VGGPHPSFHKIGYNALCTLDSGPDLQSLDLAFEVDSLQGVQIDQHASQRVVVGDGHLGAQLWPLDAQVHCLAVDPLGGGALLVDLLVLLAVTIDLVAQPSAFLSYGGQRIRPVVLSPNLVRRFNGFAPSKAQFFSWVTPDLTGIPTEELKPQLDRG